MSVHGLDRRIALGFLSIKWIGSTPAGMLAGLGAVTALLSMWVSNTATTAMMLPIGLGMLAALHRVRVARGAAPYGSIDARSWPFATAMMLMIAYAASIGGIGTPVGSPPNLIGIGLLRRSAGVEISFFQWMLLCVPMMVVMGVALFLLLHWLHRDRSVARIESGDMIEYIRAERSKLGRWTAGQVNALIAFAVAVTLWVLPGILALPWFAGSAAEQFFKNRLPESVVAIVAAVLLFFLPIGQRRFTLTWADAVKIDWGTILLFGGGLALGGLMFEAGVAEAMGKSLTGRLGVSSLWALTALSIAMGIVISETASNTASANMVVPVAIAIAQGAGVDPVPPALGAVLGASFGFMLPVSTPPNAIVYGSGLIPIGRMVRAGVLFDVLGFFLIWGGLRVLYPIVFQAR
jgi:sodium-dependent dicarboxylate transporter 2/3/5